MAGFLYDRGMDRDRTMAEAEADVGDSKKCICGSTHFVLEAYFEVEDGMMSVEPAEVESLTCPECSREYEPVLLGSGKIERGEFRRFFEDDGE
jgi:hypothetical protein